MTNGDRSNPRHRSGFAACHFGNLGGPTARHMLRSGDALNKPAVVCCLRFPDICPHMDADRKPTIHIAALAI
ncbi:hypothetical protein ACLB1Q_26985 [Escherichia coli]